jgi:signal transduction histidine kinase
MMSQFLSDNRSELEQRFRHKILERTRRAVDKQRIERNIPLFLDQIISALQVESELCGPKALAFVVPAANDANTYFEVVAWPSVGATDSLVRSIERIVLDYGDICLAIIDLASDFGRRFGIAELQTLDKFLDIGIAETVTKFSQRPVVANADELRDSLNTATLAVISTKSSNMGMSNATGALLDHSLTGLRSYINQSEVMVTETGMKVNRSVFILGDFIDEMKYSILNEAGLHRCVLNIEYIPRLLTLNADKDLLLSAVVNLLQNAYKFSGSGGEVTLSVSSSVDQILISVKSHDCCFSEYVIDDMFLPFTHSGANKIGMGMGLSLARRSIQANGGQLTVESKFGQGCTFTIALPRKGISVQDARQ